MWSANVARHAGACVADLDLDVPPGRQVLVLVGQRRVDLRIGRAHAEGTAVRHRIARVGSEIEQDPLQLGTTKPRPPQLFVELHAVLDLLTEHAAQHGFEAGDGSVHIDRRDIAGRSTAEREQLLGDPGGTLGGVADVVQGVYGRCPGSQAALGQLHVVEDHGQHVVEVVRDAAGELPQALRAAKLFELAPEPGGLELLLRVGEQCQAGADLAVCRTKRDQRDGAGQHTRPIPDVSRAQRIPRGRAAHERQLRDPERSSRPARTPGSRASRERQRCREPRAAPATRAAGRCRRRTGAGPRTSGSAGSSPAWTRNCCPDRGDFAPTVEHTPESPPGSNGKWAGQSVNGMNTLKPPSAFTSFTTFWTARAGTLRLWT